MDLKVISETWYQVHGQNTPCRCIPSSYIAVSNSQETFHWNTHWNIFRPTNLTLDLHTKIQVCMSVRSAVRVINPHTDDAKTITPRHGTDVGCKKIVCRNLITGDDYCEWHIRKLTYQKATLKWKQIQDTGGYILLQNWDIKIFIKCRRSIKDITNPWCKIGM